MPSVQVHTYPMCVMSIWSSSIELVWLCVVSRQSTLYVDSSAGTYCEVWETSLVRWGYTIFILISMSLLQLFSWNVTWTLLSKAATVWPDRARIYQQNSRSPAYQRGSIISNTMGTNCWWFSLPNPSTPPHNEGILRLNQRGATLPLQASWPSNRP